MYASLLVSHVLSGLVCAQQITEADLETCQTYMMKLFSENTSRLKALID